MPPDTRPCPTRGMVDAAKPTSEQAEAIADAVRQAAEHGEHVIPSMLRAEIAITVPISLGGCSPTGGTWSPHCGSSVESREIRRPAPAYRRTLTRTGSRGSGRSVIL